VCFGHCGDTSINYMISRSLRRSSLHPHGEPSSADFEGLSQSVMLCYYCYFHSFSPISRDFLFARIYIYIIWYDLMLAASTKKLKAYDQVCSSFGWPHLLLYAHIWSNMIPRWRATVHLMWRASYAMHLPVGDIFSQPVCGTTLRDCVQLVSPHCTNNHYPFVTLW